MAARGEPRYRAGQVLEQVFRRVVLDPNDMPNLPRPLREDLARDLLHAPLAEERVEVSGDGTRKFRFLLADGNRIESVWIPSGARGTLCMSSQAGCPARCSFCATGAGGFFRNLTPGEIVGQWAWVERYVRAHGLGTVTQIVYMGMGEPLINYAALAISLRQLTGEDGFRLSPRRITVSTVGLPREMERLMAEFPQVRLALSLHSAIDATRDRIVPMNRRHSLAALRASLVRLAPHRRRVSLEYVVLKGVNDSTVEARALARFASECAAHVNLLPFHPFPGAPHEPLDSAAMRSFRAWVQSDYGGAVTVRRSRGLDIAGACGQLALLEPLARS